MSVYLSLSPTPSLPFFNFCRTQCYCSWLIINDDDDNGDVGTCGSAVSQDVVHSEALILEVFTEQKFSFLYREVKMKLQSCLLCLLCLLILSARVSECSQYQPYRLYYTIYLQIAERNDHLCSCFQCEEETSEVLNPRGPRPVEPGFKSDKCATEKDWPICTDDEWV